MKKILMTLSLMAALPMALAAQVSKEDLKKLAAAGISDDVIVSYVRANGGVARLSAEDVIELKQAGASERVLSVALGNVPAAPAPSYTRPATEYSQPPSTTVVYDSQPYYSPSVTYSAYVGGYPYYYPYYYGGYYGGYCYPRYYNTGYCYPHYYNSCNYVSPYYRGYAGVSGYRSGVSVGVGFSSGHVGAGIGVSGYRGGHR